MKCGIISISASGRRYISNRMRRTQWHLRMRGVVARADADMRMADEMCTNMLRHINT